MMDIGNLSKEDMIQLIEYCSENIDAEEMYEHIKEKIPLNYKEVDILPRLSILIAYARMAKDVGENGVNTIVQLCKEYRLCISNQYSLEALSRFHSFLIQNKEQLNKYFPGRIEEEVESIITDYYHRNYTDKNYLRSVFRELTGKEIDDIGTQSP